MRVAPSIGRASMAAVLVTVVSIDAANLLQTKLSVVVFLVFLVAHAYEALFQNIGQWIAGVQEGRMRDDLAETLTQKGPIPATQPEQTPVAEPPTEEAPTPSVSAPPKPEPDWERLSKEPAYKRKHAALGLNRTMPG